MVIELWMSSYWRHDVLTTCREVCVLQWPLWRDRDADGSSCFGQENRPGPIAQLNRALLFAITLVAIPLVAIVYYAK
jgi:hypothetical protein